MPNVFHVMVANGTADHVRSLRFMDIVFAGHIPGEKGLVLRGTGTFGAKAY